jgi:xylulose-5-phosphate/fructose-6-phosphate phosphoketolase
MIYIIGPGHGGPGLVAHSYLEGSYAERYPNIGRSRNGMLRLFRQFPWRYGIPSHIAPETPDRSMKGASWAIPWSVPIARHSTIRI